MRDRALFFLVTLLVSSPALAAPPVEASEDLAAQLAPEDEVAQVYVSQRTEVVSSPTPPRAPAPRFPRQTSVDVGVPFFVTDSQVLRPGFGAHLRLGWELGWVVPELSIGWQANGVNGGTDDQVQTIWFSLGVRAQLLNQTPFVPFASIAFRPSWFSTYDVDYGLTSQYTFEPAVTGALGVAVEMTPSFGFELGMQVTAIFSVVNAVFRDAAGNGVNEVFLYPYAGGTFYY